MKSLYQGDCLEKMKDLSDNSVDIVCADLPYGRFAHLAWDNEIDLEKMWREIWRIGKKNCPVFLFGDMKFGVKLINSCPKYFRYEIVWNKKRTTTPLLSRKRLGKATEYVFIFYKHQPVYNYAKYHKIKGSRKCNNKKVEKSEGMQFHYEKSIRNVYEPSLPLNVVTDATSLNIRQGRLKPKKDGVKTYEPSLPLNVISQVTSTGLNIVHKNQKKIPRISYEPLLPTNVLDQELNNTPLIIGKDKMYHAKKAVYEPILPINVIEEYSVRKGKIIKNITEKPQFLLEFILKYFSNEGDTCLDMTMGSGSCGVACNKLNRNFIGIELNEKHFNLAKERLDKISLHKVKKECIKSPLIQEVKLENIILSSAHQKTKEKKSQSSKKSKKTVRFKK